MAHDPYVEAQGSPPSYLALAGHTGKYLWIARVPTSPTFVPLGIFTGPPPPELAEVQGIPVGDSNAAKAGAWITQRLHELVVVADKLKIQPPP